MNNQKNTVSNLQKSTESAIINNNIDELLEYATEKKAVQFTAYLLEYKESHFKKGKNVLDSLRYDKSRKDAHYSRAIRKSLNLK